VRVLLTGASGFVGRRLAARLAADGHVVGGLAHDLAGMPDGIEARLADVRDAAGLEQAVMRFDPDAVIHLAALSHVGESWRRIDEYFDVNVVGTENLLVAARGRRVVVVSSAEVYGLVPDAEQPIAESRPVAPRSPYALTKAVAERLALASGAAVARLFNLAGPGQQPSFALPSFAAQLAAIAAGAAEPVLAVGNLSAARDFLHVEDGAAGLARIATGGMPGRIYNVASGVAVSIAEALERLIAISGLAVRVEQDPARLRPVDVPRLCGDASRLRALGWAPSHGLEAALHDTWHEARELQAAGARA
jgi:GDP-4-dehydro-6-deoxy-D-mannose reductase